MDIIRRWGLAPSVIYTITHGQIIYHLLLFKIIKACKVLTGNESNINRIHTRQEIFLAKPACILCSLFA